jgi:hypothetical protein
MSESTYNIIANEIHIEVMFLQGLKYIFFNGKLHIELILGIWYLLIFILKHLQYKEIGTRG